jgi:hypothetical protein
MSEELKTFGTLSAIARSIGSDKRLAALRGAKPEALLITNSARLLPIYPLEIVEIIREARESRE